MVGWPDKIGCLVRDGARGETRLTGATSYPTSGAFGWETWGNSPIDAGYVEPER